MKKHRPWYAIRAAAEDQAAEVLIYDEIGRDWFGEGIGAEQFIRDIQAITAPTINVRINSMGGQVFDGLAIYNALQRHPSRVVTHVDGMAASIASVIALAGAEVHMAANAFIMIHDPHGVQFGNARDMRQFADQLDKVAGSLVKAYADKTGKTDEEVRAWMQAETWFNATEAEEAGFVDQVSESRQIAACAGDITRWARIQARIPKEVLERLNAEPEPEGPSDELLQLVAASHRTLERSRL